MARGQPCRSNQPSNKALFVPRNIFNCSLYKEINQLQEDLLSETDFPIVMTGMIVNFRIESSCSTGTGSCKLPAHPDTLATRSRGAEGRRGKSK